jgi:hypothetical protein
LVADLHEEAATLGEGNTELELELACEGIGRDADQVVRVESRPQHRLLAPVLCLLVLLLVLQRLGNRVFDAPVFQVLGFIDQQSCIRRNGGATVQLKPNHRVNGNNKLTFFMSSFDFSSFEDLSHVVRIASVAL